MKKIMIFILTLIFAMGLMAQEEPTTTIKLQGDVELEIQKEIQQEISSDMDEVKMWMGLYNAVEKYYIDIEAYPEELQNYMLPQTKIIEDYLTLVDDAEVLFYDKGDYQSKIKEAKNKLAYLKILKQIFNEYVEYKASERSKGRLALSVEGIKNSEAIPRMHIAAYTVLRGEYPMKIAYKSTSRIAMLRKEHYEYKNGDIAVFFNDYLIEVKTDG